VLFLAKLSGATCIDYIDYLTIVHMRKSVSKRENATIVGHDKKGAVV
jgi:hypothetical protein